MKTEREIPLKERCMALAKAHGHEVRQVAWLGRSNAPDTVLMCNRAAATTIWIEFKRPGGKATFPKNAHERAQQREHERMRAVGQIVRVIDSMEEFEALL